jgi:hypothetical protein
MLLNKHLVGFFAKCLVGGMSWSLQTVKDISEGFRKKNPHDFGGDEIGKLNTGRFIGVVSREINRFGTETERMGGKAFGLMGNQDKNIGVFCMGIPIENVNALPKSPNEGKVPVPVLHVPGGYMYGLWETLYNTYHTTTGFGIDCLLLGIVAIWRARVFQNEEKPFDRVLYSYLFMRNLDSFQTDFTHRKFFFARDYPRTICLVLTCDSLPLIIEGMRKILREEGLGIEEKRFFIEATENVDEDSTDLDKECHEVEIGHKKLAEALPQIVCYISKFKKGYGLKMDTETLQKLKDMIANHPRIDIFKSYYDLLYFLSMFEA